VIKNGADVPLIVVRNKWKSDGSKKLIMNNDLHPMKEKLPLNEQDIKKIRNHLIPILVFPFLAAGMFYGFYSFFWSDSTLLQAKTGLYMLIGFSLFFFGIIAYMISASVIDLRRGFKYRIKGKITDKKLSVTTSRTTTSKSGKNHSSTSRHYYVYIDGVQYAIEQQYYGKVKVGNGVIMERAPKSCITLLLEVNETATAQSTETDNGNRQFLKSTPKKAYFKQEDFKALKRGLQSKLKTRLIWFLPTLFIALSLVWSGMQAFLVFLFPLVLIPGYQLWKFIRELRQYNRNKQYAYKEGIPAVVEDKSKYTHNGRTSNTIRTTHGYLKVDNRLYEKLNTGDKVTLYTPAKGKQVLSVLTADKEEIYLL